MFYENTSLIAAPQLPATTLADNCYFRMFRYCSSLTDAPLLPAPTLANYCYYQIFANCSSLSSMNVNFTYTDGDMTYYWLQNVAAAGTFTCPTGASIRRGDSGIPNGWSIVYK